MHEPTAAIPNLPIPADAERVGEWIWDGGEGPYFRRFATYTRRVRPGVIVEVDGEQHADGRAIRAVNINGEIDLTPWEARELAAALIDGAERAERGSQL